MLNAYYQNIGMKDFLARYGWINALRRGTYLANPIHYVQDYELKKLLWQQKSAKRVEKYLKYCTREPAGLVFAGECREEPIWFYWNTGIENAPDIVKACYASVKKHEGERVILLSDDTLRSYIQMPENIEEKKKKGFMPLACYTDLLRFALLEHYGGTWMDATVYLTECIPEGIIGSDFFAFRNSLGLLDNPARYPVWFLHARRHSAVITKVRNISFAYWEKENHVMEYLLSNLIITKVLQKDPVAERAIPYISSDCSEYLVRILGETYDEAQWEWVKRLTGIHKLTYKLSPEIEKKDTFYKRLVTQQIE